jgi:hypothetical protein
MFHSIPALLIFTGVAFLISGSTNLHLRYFKAGGVFIGVLSHLMLDEIYSIEWAGGRWRFKKSFGTAIKLPQLAASETLPTETFHIGYQRRESEPAAGEPSASQAPRDRNIYDTARRLMKRFNW